MSLSSSSHLRLNPLTGEQVLVSPHRTERPWQGQKDQGEADPAKPYDDTCYLCPGNRRANNEKNPDYQGCFVFENDFAALSAAGGQAPAAIDDGLFQAQPETGRCRVVCYTEQHDLRLATMSVSAVAEALSAMFEEFRQLDADDNIAYVQMFENRGAMMGCSNPHPHAQIWATGSVPTEPAKERKTQADYARKNGSSMLVDYIERELELDERVVAANDDVVAVVPYWALWPYEILWVATGGASSPLEWSSREVESLAWVLKRVLTAYDQLFGTSTPYSMGFHPRPSDGGDAAGWVFHGHIYPPLLRSAEVRKHMVGFEMFAMPQRDLTPEVAAERLKLHV